MDEETGIKDSEKQERDKMSVSKDYKVDTPAFKIMRTILTAGVLGSLLFGTLYCFCDMDWMLTGAIIFGMFAYHMAVRFLTPVMLFGIFHKRYDHNSKWFRQRPWEKTLYQFLRVRKWKNQAITYDPGEYSMEKNSLEEIVNNMCHAELVHEWIVVFSFLSLLFSIPFGSFSAFFITALLSAVIECTFVVIQRYNRPRVVRIMDKKKKYDLQRKGR